MAQISAPLFDLLVALAKGPQHGYALMLRVEELHGGAYRPSPGVVYSNLQRGMDAGWVEDIATAPDEDGRKRLYQLTQEGKAAATAQAREMASRAGQALRSLEGTSSC